MIELISTPPRSPSFRNQRGDTLVEVTMALAILALVLTSAFALANKAYRIGQDAKERSQMVSDAQAQAEALQNYRDSHTWHDFVLGASAPGGVPGIRVRNASCGTSTACFHMAVQNINGVDQWVPVAGSGTDSQIGGQGYVRIRVAQVNAPFGASGGSVGDPAPGSIQQSYQFVVEYGIPPRGGGAILASDLKVYLTNMDALRQ